MKRRAAGFTLIEVLVGLVITVIVVAALVGLGKGWLSSSSQQQNVAAEAQEIDAFYRAASRYVTEKASTISVGFAGVDVTELVNAGYLPALFAARGDDIGMTPWFQKYALVVRKKSDGQIRGLIYERYAIDPARLAKTGVPNTTSAIATLKSSIAMRLAADYRVPAGTLEPGSSLVSGAFGAFSKNVAGDISGIIASSFSVPTVGVLVNFPDLASLDANNGNDGSPPTVLPHTSLLGCNIVHPNLSTMTAPVCPAATPVQVAKWPYCAPWNNAFPRYSAYPSDAGTITSGIVRRQLDSVYICSNAQWAWLDHADSLPPGTPYDRYAFCPRYYNEIDNAQAFIQGGVFIDEGCRDIKQGLGNPASCTPLTAAAGDLFHGNQCTQETNRPEIATLGTNGYNILCCAQ